MKYINRAAVIFVLLSSSVCDTNANQKPVELTRTGELADGDKFHFKTHEHLYNKNINK